MTAPSILPARPPGTLSVGRSAQVLPTRWWAVGPSGDLDLATGPALDASLRQMAAQHRGDGVVLDLSSVTFMDCAGLRPLMRARAQLDDRFCLRAVPPRILRFLTLANVAGSLRILPWLESWPAEAAPQRCIELPRSTPQTSPAAPINCCVDWPGRSGPW
jgi:anti-anti-sigma factor